MKAVILRMLPLLASSSRLLALHLPLRYYSRSRSPATRWLGATTASSSSSSSSSSQSSSKETTAPPVSTKKEQRYQNARARRKQILGVAKAVDRGQYKNVYQPFCRKTQSFAAHSGLPNDRKIPFCVLGIESSCDDTGAAILRSDGTILGESLASQAAIHEPWGGVVPGLARDAHAAQIDAVVQQALAQANMSMEDMDAVGVTVGPGLEICLRVGCTKARELALEYDKPFVGVHHLEAHILMARLPVHNNKNDDDNTTTMHHTPATDQVHETVRAMEFPFLALLVSGGHCQLMECRGVGDYTVLGGTLDDSLGEAFDKTARLLGLPVGGGGGPALEQLALDGDPTAVALPVPLQRRRDLDFSYAGLKTAVLKAAENLAQEENVEAIVDLSHQAKANIAASFQNVSIKHLEQRLKYVMEQMEKDTSSGIRTLAVVGGVAANTELRQRLQTVCDNRQWKLQVPPPRLCTDQGAMSAWAAIERILVGSTDDPTNQEVYARYPFAVVADENNDSNEASP